MAVIVCVPVLKELFEKLPPVPIWPLMLEVQTRLEVRIPSSASVALPVNEIEEPELKLEPLVGVEMVTTGAVFTGCCTATATVALPVLPAESVTLAVMV